MKEPRVTYLDIVATLLRHALPAMLELPRSMWEAWHEDNPYKVERRRLAALKRAGK